MWSGGRLCCRMTSSIRRASPHPVRAGPQSRRPETLRHAQASNASNAAFSASGAGRPVRVGAGVPGRQHRGCDVLRGAERCRRRGQVGVRPVGRYRCVHNGLRPTALAIALVSRRVQVSSPPEWLHVSHSPTAGKETLCRRSPAAAQSLHQMCGQADGTDPFPAMCAGSDEDEKAVKEATSATLRCFPFEQPPTVGRCFYTGGDATEVAIFAKAY